MPNVDAERLRSHADELEALDDAHIAIIGVVMRNAADELDKFESKLDAAINLIASAGPLFWCMHGHEPEVVEQANEWEKQAAELIGVKP